MASLVDIIVDATEWGICCKALFTHTVNVTIFIRALHYFDVMCKQHHRTVSNSNLKFLKR